MDYNVSWEFANNLSTEKQKTNEICTVVVMKCFEGIKIEKRKIYSCLLPKTPMVHIILP